MSRGTFIENEARYEAAIQRNIRMNARKTRAAKWLATEEGKRANAFLFELDEFEQRIAPRDASKADELNAELSELNVRDSAYFQDRDALCEMYNATYIMHPVVKASLGSFYEKMRDSVIEWGALTEGQTKAVLDMIVRGEGRVSERAKAREEARQADADKSGWIGTIGERRVFDLTIRMVVEMSGQYGYSYLHVMHDADGNVVVYKGTNELGKSKDVVSVKATVKEHSIRDGVRQTKIARPAAAN
jgi:hypothetical protein